MAVQIAVETHMAMKLEELADELVEIAAAINRAKFVDPESPLVQQLIGCGWCLANWSQQFKAMLQLREKGTLDG